MDTLPLSISDLEYERIKESEAVVITNYSGPEGRFSKLRFIGSREEAEVIASTPQIVIVPTGTSCDGCEVVNTSDLISPQQFEAQIAAGVPLHQIRQAADDAEQAEQIA